MACCTILEYIALTLFLGYVKRRYAGLQSRGIPIRHLGA